MAKATLREAYNAWLSTSHAGDWCGFGETRRLVGCLMSSYRQPNALTKKETIDVAKKVLSRKLAADWTRAEVEAFLRGE